MVATLDPREGLTKYAFDAGGNLVALTDPVLNITSYAYSVANQKLSETNALGQTRSLTYDSLGRLTEQKDRRGWRRQFAYDHLSRPTTETWLDPTTQAVTRTITTAFDWANQVTGSSDPSVASYAYTPDLAGRVTSATATLAGVTPVFAFSQSFDNLNRRTQFKVNFGAAPDLQNDYQYDALSRMTQVMQVAQAGAPSIAAKRVNLAYNLAGQFTAIGRYNNVAGGGANEVSTSTFGYTDAQGRLTSLEHRKGAASPQADYAWAYDAFSRLTSFGSTKNPSENASYSYDSTGQLIGASYANGGLTNESYVYDTNGNRTNTASASYTLGANNQILRDGTYEYQYDAEGNQTRRITLQGGAATGPTRTYAWDHRNRLTQVTETTSPNSGATTTKVTVYAYDGLNRRVSKVTAASVAGLATAAKTYFVYDDAAGNAILDLVDNDGNGAQGAAISRRYLHGPAVDQVLAEEDVNAAIGAAGRVLWHLGDQLGSTRDLVDNTGVLATHYKFDSFGAIKSGDTSKTRYIFTNQEYDSDTGLCYFTRRWYDPNIGRFLSEDPNPAGTFADGANNYAYVHNGPVNATDPTGWAKYTYGAADPNYPWGPWTAFGVLPPTAGSMAIMTALLTAMTVEQAFWDMFDAYSHFRHFLDLSGSDIDLPVERLLTETSTVRRAFELERDQAIKFATAITKPGVYDITSRGTTSKFIGITDSPNWFFAMAGFDSWGKGRVSVSCADANKGTRIYTLHFKFKVADSYNWANAKLPTGVPGVTDKMMHQLVLEGMAKEFKMHGSVLRKFQWRSDQPGRIIEMTPALDPDDFAPPKSLAW